MNILRTRVGIALAVGISIVVIAITIKLNESSSSSSTALSPAVQKAIEGTLDRDDDGDGLKNWEEALYKTDILNPDSDGDGRTDNEEAIYGLDPTVVETEAQLSESVTVIPNFTATDRFSQEILQKYVEAKQLGLDINEEVSMQIAENVLNQDYSDVKNPYTAKDINISEVGARQYGNKLGQILNTPPAAKITELDIFPLLATDSITTHEKDLTAIKGRYERILKAILAQPTPVEAAESQVKLANSISLFIDSVDGALKIEEDPIGSLTKISRYQFGLDLLEAALLGVRVYFNSEKVRFSASESGYILTQ